MFAKQGQDLFTVRQDDIICHNHSRPLYDELVLELFNCVAKVSLKKSLILLYQYINRVPTSKNPRIS